VQPEDHHARGSIAALALHPHRLSTPVAQSRSDNRAKRPLPRKNVGEGRTAGRRRKGKSRWRESSGTAIDRLVAAQRAHNRIHHSLDVLHHLDVPESQHAEALALKHSSAPLIVRNIVEVL